MKIGLDVDGVLADFSGGVIKRAAQLGLQNEFPSCSKDVDCWDMSPSFSKVMKDVWTDPEFWLGLEPLIAKIPFKVECYITSRQIPSSVTAEWLKKNGFPEAPVITVKNPTEKLEHVNRLGLDLFVDDYYPTVHALRDAGHEALLYGAPYQRGHAEGCAGLPAVNTLEEALEYGTVNCGEN